MMITVLSIGVITFWAISNIAVASTMTKAEMYEDFVTGQNKVGKILANTFYFPAWIIKKISR
jgi:hypothetical protein